MIEGDGVGVGGVGCGKMERVGNILLIYELLKREQTKRIA